MNRYYEKALTSNNPLIIGLFEEYKDFKKRGFINEFQSINEHGIVNIEALELIRHTINCV
jgi:hypothetical protein